MAEPPKPPSSPASGSAPPLSPSRGELPILQATTDLIKWFVPLLNGLPRDQTFALGDRIISNLYAVLEALVSARWSRDKLPLLESAAARLDLLRIQTRLLHDFQLIDTRRYEHASRLLEAVATGVCSSEAARRSLQSWNAHRAHGHTLRLRRSLFAGLAFAPSLP